MRYQGINLGNVKTSNRSAVLRLLNSQGAMSRKDIAEAIGLTAASVTFICTELLEEGIIMEIGEVEGQKRAGRKKILVDINNQYKYVLCIGIETNETYVSITDLAGNMKGNRVIITNTEIEPREFLICIADECKKLMWEQGISKEKIMGVGVSIPGMVDRDQGISLHAYNIWDRPVAVGSIIKEQLGYEVVIENNVKAYAESEILFGHGRAEDNMILVKWGPGVGSSIIINNQVYQGANGLSSEIGHMTFGKNKKLCKCGRKGCLETMISTHAIIDDVYATYGRTEETQSQMPILREWLNKGNMLTYKNTYEWGAIEDAKLQEIIDDKLDKLAHTIRNTISIVDPNRVILLGYLFDVPGYFERFKEIYKEYDGEVSDDFFTMSDLKAKTYHTESLSIVLEEMFY